MKRNKFMGYFLCNNSKDDEVALKEKRNGNQTKITVPLYKKAAPMM